MKEYLFEFNGKYSLVKRSAEYADGLPQYIEIPEGAIEARLNGSGRINFIDSESNYMNAATSGQWIGTHKHRHDVHELVWSRGVLEKAKHSHYFKDVSNLDEIDVYRVLELFEVKSHAVGHAIKKLLCSGGRGAKDEAQDIQEAIDTLVRYQEMVREDVRNKS